MSRQVLPGLAALLSLSACTDHVRHVETTPVSRHVRWQPEPGLPERNHLLLEPVPTAVRVYSRATTLCRQDVVTVKRRDEVVDISAAEGRWVGAAAMLGAAGLAYKWTDSASLAASLALGGTAIIVVPMAAERRKRTTLGYEEDVAPAPPAPCAERALAGSRVVIRDGKATHEVTTDATGTALLPSVDVTSVRAAYIEDIPVPWFVVRRR